MSIFLSIFCPNAQTSFPVEFQRSLKQEELAIAQFQYYSVCRRRFPRTHFPVSQNLFNRSVWMTRFSDDYVGMYISHSFLWFPRCLTSSKVANSLSTNNKRPFGRSHEIQYHCCARFGNFVFIF